jgi:hypothetical protein
MIRLEKKSRGSTPTVPLHSSKNGRGNIKTNWCTSLTSSCHLNLPRLKDNQDIKVVVKTPHPGSLNFPLRSHLSPAALKRAPTITCRSWAKCRVNSSFNHFIKILLSIKNCCQASPSNQEIRKPKISNSPLRVRFKNQTLSFATNLGRWTPSTNSSQRTS